MMVSDNDHSTCVNAWMERTAKGLPPERLLQVFEQSFAALWRRAHQTLGDVTLTAIVDRVLYVAAEQHPLLSALKVEETGLRVQDLHERAAGLEHDRVSEVSEAVRFVMVEFLTVLGNLTSEILTPALHAELSNVPAEGGHDENGSRGGPPSPENKGGEGATS